MDIEAHLSLRSMSKPNVNPIYVALVGALFVHALLWINWTVKQNSKVAAIPEWVNVKLIAGFEDIENKVEKIKSEKKIIKQESKVIKNNLPVKKIESASENKSSLTKPTTFIAADSRPYMLENAKPVYPSMARRRGMHGVVLLSVAINEEGYVDKIAILKTSGFKILDRSALSSVEGWRFIPAKEGNENVSSEMQIPIRFILNDV